MAQGIVEGVMPNHKPHTYSHEDVLFLLETFKHCHEYVWKQYADVHDDIDRCIKILEKDSE